MKAEAVETGIAISGPFWINDIFYNSGQLVIKINSKDDDQCVTATFSEICGFRILDEGDLLEFWPTCSQGKGWLFRVIDGGWFDQESQRSGFLRGDVKGITEFFLPGKNDCVSVFAWDLPVVRKCAT
jgi:hypothetical protein